MHAAVVAAAERPHPRAHPVTLMALVSPAATVAFVILGAADDRAVSVHEERAGAGHARTAFLKEQGAVKFVCAGHVGAGSRAEVGDDDEAGCRCRTMFGAS